MTYFSKQWTEALELPDGSVADCVQDVDRYLKANNLSPAGDFSDAYRREAKFSREQAVRKEFFAEFPQRVEAIRLGFPIITTYTHLLH